MIRIILLIGMMMAGFFAAPEARAQLFLEDGKKVFVVSGGDHLTGTLMIHNTSGDTANVKVYWEDFEYKAPYDGTKKFLPAGTSPTSASQWVTFTPQQFAMPGYGKQAVDYTLTIPSTIQEGHYGVLFFERSGETLQGEGGLTLVTRVGCLFFVEPKNKNKNAVLENWSAKGSSITADFSNQGNVVLIPHTTFYLMQDSGVVVLRGEIGKLYVPPGALATLAIPLKKNLQAGNYTLVVNGDLDDGDVVVKEISLAVDASGQMTIGKIQD